MKSVCWRRSDEALSRRQILQRRGKRRQREKRTPGPNPQRETKRAPRPRARRFSACSAWGRAALGPQRKERWSPVSGCAHDGFRKCFNFVALSLQFAQANCPIGHFAQICVPLPNKPPLRSCVAIYAALCCVFVL